MDTTVAALNRAASALAAAAATGGLPPAAAAAVATARSAVADAQGVVGEAAGGPSAGGSAEGAAWIGDSSSGGSDHGGGGGGGRSSAGSSHGGGASGGGDGTNGVEDAGASGVDDSGVASAMSNDAADSNPYSRLMALQRMGIVADYASIRARTVVVIGIGGVGAVVADMLTRCGVGRLHLLDADTVRPANINRLFYTPAQVGVAKVVAATAALTAINPDVVVTPHRVDVTDGTPGGGYDTLTTVLATADVAVACVDNYAARLAVNRAALGAPAGGIAWIETGVAEDALSGHVQRLAPGRTACYACVPPLVVATGEGEAGIRRAGVCAASLPTTMAIVAALAVQALLKGLLGWGDLADYVGYEGRRDWVCVLSALQPNGECTEGECVAAQRAVAAGRGGGGGESEGMWRRGGPAPTATATVTATAADATTAAVAPADTETVRVAHPVNEWGILLVGEGGKGGDDDTPLPPPLLPMPARPPPPFAADSPASLPGGPSPSGAATGTTTAPPRPSPPEPSIEELMAELRGLHP